MADDLSSDSEGQSFLPSAFVGEVAIYGRKLAQMEQFYDAFVFFITAVANDATQLVHFRAPLIEQATVHCSELTSENVNAIMWCALSYATDRYFSAFGVHARDGLSRVTELKRKWFKFMSLAFLPMTEAQRLDVTQIKAWGMEFANLHKHNLGVVLSQRDQLIGVIVKQAIAGVSWKEQNRRVMLDQNITVEDVEVEIARRSP